MILESRYPTSGDPLKLREIAEGFGVTRDAVRQIEAKAVQRLKAVLEGKQPVDALSKKR